jgi:pimeloyl-ACP methyl ester carboxylesterase
MQDLSRRYDGGIADSPIGLAAWLLDHNDAGDGDVVENLVPHQFPVALVVPVEGRGDRRRSAGHQVTNRRFLAPISIGRINSGISTPKRFHPGCRKRLSGRDRSVPVELAERVYPKLIHNNKAEKGGHFAAGEQPQLFSEEVRAGFRPLRN